MPDSATDATSPGESVCVPVTFALTEDEVVRSIRRAQLRQGRFRGMYTFGVLLVIAGTLVWLLAPRFHATAVIAIFSGSYFILALSVSVWRTPHAAWRRSMALRATQHLTFSDHGVEAKGEDFESKSAWSRFSTSNEYDGGYLLRLAKSGVELTIPRRGFRSLDDEWAFRQLLQRHTASQLRTTTREP